ncbi:MAG: transcription elongation factor subunit Spt4 [Candidatus Pacearchaeota archaeon]
MAKEKACKVCKTIYEEERCPNCNNQEYSEDFKGKMIILNPEKSEVAKNLKITKRGNYTIKI